jgi:hypothetical protein
MNGAAASVEVAVRIYTRRQAVSTGVSQFEVLNDQLRRRNEFRHWHVD